MAHDEFEDQDCICCFIRFRVPKGFTERRRQDKRSFFCPNGHSMSYTENEADRLRRERDRLKQDQARLEDEARMWQATADDQRRQREAAERQAAAARGQVTKLKNRAANGVCPCCNRTFQNLARHMATKHPTFMADDVTASQVAH
jgi:hypothetical protein